MDQLETPAGRTEAVAVWTLKTRDPRTGLYLPRLVRRNKFTDYGLTQLAGRWAGSGSAPVYLIIDNFKGKVTTATAPGANAINLDKRVDQAGDTQIVVGVGQPGQETVSFTGVSGSGPYTYALSTGLVNSHTLNEWVARAVRQADTLANVQAEVQYDAVAAPNARMRSSGGYSPGSGQWTMQFFLTGTQAVTDWLTLGLSDTGIVGAGQLHNHLVFGFTHAALEDVELDVTLTIANA